MRWFLTSILTLTAITGSSLGFSQAYAGTKAHVASATLAKTDMKIGKLYLGEKLRSVQKQYGRPNIKTIVHGQGGSRWEYTKLGFSLDGNPTWQIEVSNSKIGSTPRGVHVGSNEVSVKKAYPKLKSTYPNQLFEQENGYAIDFMFKNGVVSKVILVNEKI